MYPSLDRQEGAEAVQMSTALVEQRVCARARACVRGLVADLQSAYIPGFSLQLCPVVKTRIVRAVVEGLYCFPAPRPRPRGCRRSGCEESKSDLNHIENWMSSQPAPVGACESKCMCDAQSRCTITPLSMQDLREERKYKTNVDDPVAFGILIKRLLQLHVYTAYPHVSPQRQPEISLSSSQCTHG